MWAFLRRQGLYFLTGFVIAFVIYLFVRFNADAVMLGIIISAAAGVVLSVSLWWLEKRYDERNPPPTTIGGNR